MVSKVKGLVGAYAGVQGIKMSLDWVQGNLELSDVQRNAENQLKTVLANVGTGEGAFDKLAAKASGIQGLGMYGDEAMLGGAAELATYISDTDALASMMGTLTNFAAGMSGGGAVGYQEMVNYATQLGKALDGTYDGLTKKGFTLTETQKQIIETGTDMEKALVLDEVIAQSWDGLYEAMSNTPEGKIISLQNRWGDLREVLGDRLYPAVLQIVEGINTRWPQIETIMNGLAQGANVLVTVLGWLLNAAINTGGAIVENWNWIGPIVYGVVGAMLAYRAVTTTCTAAQWLLNAAMAANPVGLVIALVVLLIAVIYAVCTAIANATDRASSGFGVICGSIMVAAAFMQNLGLSTANVALGIWEVLCACALNMQTAFHNAICNVRGWFFELLATALTVVAGICEALNRLPFVEFDYSGITGKAEEYAGRATSAIGEKREYIGLSDAFQKGMSTYDAFSNNWASDAFEAGVAWGDGVADKAAGLFDFGGLEAFELGEDEIPVLGELTARELAPERGQAKWNGS